MHACIDLPRAAGRANARALDSALAYIASNGQFRREGEYIGHQHDSASTHGRADWSSGSSCLRVRIRANAEASRVRLIICLTVGYSTAISRCLDPPSPLVPLPSSPPTRHLTWTTGVSSTVIVRNVARPSIAMAHRGTPLPHEASAAEPFRPGRTTR